MALRFQKASDEVDKQVKGERSIGIWVLLYLLATVAYGVTSWLSGKTMHSYLQSVGFMAVWTFVGWLIFPIYSEYRLRSKEIYGTVTEISQAISALHQRMDAIEEELRLRRYER